MIDQKRKINEREWDILLVLDACRYDYFERNYGDYIKGELKKAHSPVDCTSGVATSEWCKEVFTEKYEDVVYLSTTPHINSSTSVNGFSGKNHFFEVVDVWKTDWNDEKGTVYPGKLNEKIIESADKYPDKKIIAHYMQPHFPYLSLDNPFNPKNRNPESHDDFRRKLRNFFGSKIRRKIGDKWTRKIINSLNLPPPNPMYETLERIGEEGLLEAYEDNLIKVLESIKELSEDIDGQTFITADHGEYLGERGFYGHSYLPQHEVLNQVPWFRLDL